VRVRSSVDPSLLGGVIVRVGDLLIDGSALTRLNQLGRTLKSAQLN
jgi:F0F1-type ATP synthase delta subunit